MAEGLTKAHFRVMEELGRGNYGVVYKVIYTGDELCYVLKTIALSLLSPKQQKDALQEVSLLRKVDHPHLTRYYASFIEDNTLHILMEYVDGGDLQQAVRSHKEKHKFMLENRVWQIAYEAALAVQYLHSLHIIHRDIKPLNILLTKTGRVKVGDLGVATLLEGRGMEKQARVGTPLFLAPEVVRQQDYDYKVDIWGLGCVLYTLTAQEHPFKGESLSALGQNILTQTPKQPPRIYSQRLTDLISRMMSKRQKDRPDITQVLAAIPGDVRHAYEPPVRLQPPFRFVARLQTNTLSEPDAPGDTQHPLKEGEVEKSRGVRMPPIYNARGNEGFPERKGVRRRASGVSGDQLAHLGRQRSQPANIHVTCLPGDISPSMKLPTARTDFPLVYFREGPPAVSRRMTIRDLTAT